MPHVPVPKDLSKVKTKVIFNLTKRQLVCFGIAVIIGVPTYLLTRGSLGNENAMLLMIVLMFPFFLFAMYEKNSQPLEKILKNYITTTFLSPVNRPYQTQNMYMALENLKKEDTNDDTEK